MLKIVTTPGTIAGDTNWNLLLDISDPMGIARSAFLGIQPNCPPAADFDQDGAVGIGDTMGLLHTLFLGIGTPFSFVADRRVSCDGGWKLANAVAIRGAHEGS